MHLYNLTLQPSQAIVKAVCGSFSGTKQQEIVVAHNSTIDLLRLDLKTGKLCTILKQKMFGLVRSIVPFRLIGSLKDYLVVANDSGKLIILSYDPENNAFDKVTEETFGKSGCRRTVPGQYLTADPKGRAVMIGAIEKERLVYILNRDSFMNLTISSPLEVHRSSTLIHDMTALDVGFENPVFANIEVDYSEIDYDTRIEVLENYKKHITYYELDLGLNCVVRKGSDVIDQSSNLLIAIPGASNGPGGVLVCSENFITWVNKDCTPVRIPIPKRPEHLISHPYQNNDTQNGDNQNSTTGGVIIVTAAMHMLKGGFFVFVQTEDGDIFKVTMDYTVSTDCNNSPVKNLKIKYIDTLPTAISICLLKSGFLFSASEFGDHCIYQIEDIGSDDTDQVEYDSSKIKNLNEPITFQPRPLKNLSLVDTLLSLCPIISAKVIESPDEENPLIYSLCGRGARSSLRVIKHGLEVLQLAMSSLPGVPSAVWTIRKSSNDEYDSYIVVSFTNATLVLSVGEIVEEVSNSTLLTNVPTMMIAQLGDNALAQIYPKGVRCIRSGRKNEWKCADDRSIVHATCNQRQIVIALTGGELVYFELDATENLNEYQERRELSSEVTALAVGSVPPGRQRCSFLVVGCADNTIRVISLNPENCLNLLSVQVLRWSPSSIILTETISENNSTLTNQEPLGLHVGLSTGILISASIDRTTGMIGDSRIKYLGAKPVKVFSVVVNGNNAILALCNKSWLCLNDRDNLRYLPLIYDSLDYAFNFKSEQFPEAIVGITGNTLHILTVENSTDIFSQTIVPLQFTPRGFTHHKTTNNIIVVESDCAVYCKSDLEKIRDITSTGDQIDNDNKQDSKKLQLQSPEKISNLRAHKENWASCIRVIDPLRAEEVYLETLDKNEAAFSVTSCMFQSQYDFNYIVVSIAKDVKLSPLSFTESHISVYTLSGQKLELVHKTNIEGIARALCAFQGKLLVGMGKTLKMYSMGKKRLLRKCETSKFPNNIVTIQVQGNRIVVCDVQESVFYAIYKPLDNRIVVFADDTVPRWVVSSTLLDYNTICVGDKFGNISVNRLSKTISQEVDENYSGNKFAFEKGILNGAPYKVSHAAEFFIGETVTSVTNISMNKNEPQVILYTTLMGGIGVLIPFMYKEDYDILHALEVQLRSKLPPLSGRSHISFRSYYMPVHHVIDGDLCEMYTQLPIDTKIEIATDLEREPNELLRKIQDMRDKYVF